MLESYPEVRSALMFVVIRRTFAMFMENSVSPFRYMGREGQLKLFVFLQTYLDACVLMHDSENVRQ